jgi:CheY-like chemotaxis protein
MSATILVVDDMPIVRDPIAASLRHGGYETICASNGVEALKAVGREPPALIVLDMSMPIMDGIAFLRVLRADKRYTTLPVILLTAFNEKELVVEAAKLGVKDYILKSKFSLSDLLARVKKHLDSNNAAEAPAPAQGGTTQAA